MNKRTADLFAQALDEAVPETWTTLGPVQLMRLRDKFAELIVKECGKFVNRTVDRVEMKEHFGVNDE